MRKRILLIGYNYYPEPTGIGKYTGEMINWFHKQGYDCTVLTSYPYYPFWKVQPPYDKKKGWYSVEKSTDPQSGSNLKVIRCPQYVPSKPSGMKRVLLDLSFFVSALFPLIGLLFSKKHDAVVTIAPAFQNGLLGVLYKKLKKATHVYHIQDMQIEAARDLKMIRSKSLINILFKIEKYIFDQTDVVSSISDGMVKGIQQKAGKPVYLFANWTDVSAFHRIKDKGAIKEGYGFSALDKIVLYSGSIGEKQGLEAILHAANDLSQHPELRFIICGSGPYKPHLEKMAGDLNLKNLSFLPIQPFEKFNEFLNLADVHLVIQKASASDLVMPSKLTTILSVGGLALITANPGSGLHTLVNDHNIGLVVEAENQQALNNGILKATKEDNSALNDRARVYAENYLAIEMIMRRFEEFVFKKQENVLSTFTTSNEGGTNQGNQGTVEAVAVAGRQVKRIQISSNV